MVNQVAGHCSPSSGTLISEASRCVLGRQNQAGRAIDAIVRMERRRRPMGHHYLRRQHYSNPRSAVLSPVGSANLIPFVARREVDPSLDCSGHRPSRLSSLPSCLRPVALPTRCQPVLRACRLPPPPSRALPALPRRLAARLRQRRLALPTRLRPRSRPTRLRRSQAQLPRLPQARRRRLQGTWSCRSCP